MGGADIECVLQENVNAVYSEQPYALPTAKNAILVHPDKGSE
jgi:hypothetical protein